MKICKQCNINETTKKLCEECKVKNRVEYKAKWNKENKERLSKNNKQRYLDNKEAIDEKARLYRKNNPELKKQQDKDYYEKNKKVLLEKAKEYVAKNVEKTKEYKKAWALLNSEKIKVKAKKRYEANKDELYAKVKERIANDPLFALTVQLRKSILKAFRKRGYEKKGRTQEILGCTFEEFKLHLESMFAEWMNWDNRGLYNGQPNHGWDIDHITPLSTANSIEDIIKLNHYTNLRPFCSYNNRVIKRNRIE